MTSEELKSRLQYDPETGVFTWLSGRRVGRVAGCTFSAGYRNIGWCGRMIGEHRLAWLYVHGVLPKQVDHINGNPADNRIANLRLATQAQNRQNSRVRRDSRSGYKGVVYCADHKKWRAMIGPRGNVKHLGYFESAELAHAAYCQAAKQMYGEFARAT